MGALARIGQAAAASLVGASLALTAPASAASPHPAAAVTTAHATTPTTIVTPAATSTTCSAVLFFGARGSGAYGPGSANWPAGRLASDYYGLGSTVAAVRARLIARLGTARTVSTASLSYSASRVTTLAHAPSQYFAGITVGVSSAVKYLQARAAACPSQQIVLSGHSQGAMVMHRVLHALSRYPAILHRVAAVVLVADGDSVPNDYQTRYGSAWVSTNGIAQALRSVSGASPLKFTRGQKPIVLSVCTYTDPVCDFSQTFGLSSTRLLSATSLINLLAGKAVLFANGYLIHTHYAGKPILNAATDRAAYLVRTTPWPLPQRPLVDATAGSPLTYQLLADVARGYALQWAYATSQTLPPGLTLSSAGAIIGSPTTVGDVTVPLRVRSLILGVGSMWVPAWVTVHTTAAVPTSHLQLVSTAQDGTPGNGESAQPVISPDGTKVAFISKATNLASVAVPTNGASSVLVKDLITGAVTVASSSSDGIPAVGGGYYPAFSADSKHLTFTSRSLGLTPDAIDQPEVFVKNLETGETVLASAALNGTVANYGAQRSTLSADGTKVAFLSPSLNLVPGQMGNGTTDHAFVKDLTTGAITVVDEVNGTLSNGEALSARINAEGALVAFNTLGSSNLLPVAPCCDGVYVKDLTSGAITVATARGDGQPDGGEPQFTGDGHSLVFETGAWAVAGDGPSSSIIAVRDLITGAVREVSINADGSELPNWSYSATASQDGNWISFTTWIEPGTGQNEVYLKDMITGDLTLLSTGNGASGGAISSIDSAGDKVAFISWAQLTGVENGNLNQILLFTR